MMLAIASLLFYWSIAAIVVCGFFACLVGREPVRAPLSYAKRVEGL